MTENEKLYARITERAGGTGLHVPGIILFWTVFFTVLAAGLAATAVGFAGWALLLLLPAAFFTQAAVVGARAYEGRPRA